MSGKELGRAITEFKSWVYRDAQDKSETEKKQIFADYVNSTNIDVILEDFGKVVNYV